MLVVRWDVLLSSVIEGFFQGCGFVGAVLLVAFCLRIAGVFKGNPPAQRRSHGCSCSSCGGLK